MKGAGKHRIATEVDLWYRKARAPKWEALSDVRFIFASTDKVDDF